MDIAVGAVSVANPLGGWIIGGGGRVLLGCLTYAFITRDRDEWDGELRKLTPDLEDRRDDDDPGSERDHHDHPDPQREPGDLGSGQLDRVACGDPRGEVPQDRRGQTHPQRCQRAAQHPRDLRHRLTALSPRQRPHHRPGIAAPLLLHLRGHTTTPAGRGTRPWADRVRGARRHDRSCSVELAFEPP